MVVPGASPCLRLTHQTCLWAASGRICRSWKRRAAPRGGWWSAVRPGMKSNGGPEPSESVAIPSEGPFTSPSRERRASSSRGNARAAARRLHITR